MLDRKPWVIDAEGSLAANPAFLAVGPDTEYLCTVIPEFTQTVVK